MRSFHPRVEALEPICPPSSLAAGQAEPLSLLTLALWSRPPGQPGQGGPGPAGQQCGARIFSEWHPTPAELPEDFYPEIHPVYVGQWGFDFRAPDGDHYDSVRVASPINHDAPYRMSVCPDTPGDWIGYTPDGGVHVQTSYGAAGIYVVQAHLVSGATTTSFVFAGAGEGNTERTKQTQPVKIPLSRNWDVIAVASVSQPDEYLDDAGRVPQVNARPANVGDLVHSIDVAYGRVGRPLRVVLVAHGNPTGFWLGDRDGMFGNNAYVQSFVAGARGKVKEFYLLSCYVIDGLLDGKRYPNHVLRNIAAGLYDGTNRVFVEGYTKESYAIDNGWSWQQLRRDAYMARDVHARFYRFSIPERLPAPQPERVR